MKVKSRDLQGPRATLTAGSRRQNVLAQTLEPTLLLLTPTPATSFPGLLTKREDGVPAIQIALPEREQGTGPLGEEGDID